MDIASIITAIGVIVIGWLNYNQQNHNKKFELEVEKYRDKETINKNAYKQNISRIYGSLYKLLGLLNCDRVEIVQPHPLREGHWLSISLSVYQNGVSDAKDIFQNIEMDNIPKLVGDFSSRPFIIWRDIRTDCKDVVFRSIASLCGTDMMCVQRLEDADKVWIGNLLATWTTNREIKIDEVIKIDYIKDTMKDIAEAIQYILPEYEPTEPMPTKKSRNYEQR